MLVPLLPVIRMNLQKKQSNSPGTKNIQQATKRKLACNRLLAVLSFLLVCVHILSYEGLHVVLFETFKEPTRIPTTEHNVTQAVNEFP